LYASPNITRVIKLAGHIVRIGETRNACNILVGKPEGKRDHSGDLGVDGKIILEWILGKYGGKV
jgi:hypothetical protein